MVTDFENRQDLKGAGGSLFVNSNPANQEKSPDRFSVKQGYYETSNVNITNEMIEMMQALRAYETYTKVDQVFSDTLGKLIELGKF